MQELTYQLYGIIFRIAKLCPIKKKKVVFYMIHNSNFKDNLRFVYEEMKRRDSSFRFVVVSKRDLFASSSKWLPIKIWNKLSGALYFYVVLNYHFATAEYICLNDNFLPLAHMPLKKGTKLIQFWHGAGAFKQFGLSTETDNIVRRMVKRGNRQVDYLFVTSKNVIPYYEQALGIAANHIYPVGLPVTDYYYQTNRHEEALKKLHKKYPSTKHKKVILYAPTFRNTMNENNCILQHFDCEKMVRELGDQYEILVRMHPQVRPEHRNIPLPCIDVTDYEDVKELYLLSDILITDYSSVVVEYALLNKPIIFYAYDVERYDRGFYGSYESMVPGIVVKNMDDLVDVVLNPLNSEFDKKRENFLKTQYEYLDGKATTRVVDVIMG